jgi:hypothetical protein
VSDLLNGPAAPFYNLLLAYIGTQEPAR